jgi:TRAP-type C4-dicarboxylate transport system permease small subunit
VEAMKKTLSIFLRIDKVIEVIQIILITLGVFAMVVINGAQVFCRFVIRSSIPWSEQISVMVFFILIMLGGNLAMRTDTETRI